MTDQLLRVSEAARLAQVTIPTIRSWIRKGILQSERVGPFRRLRIAQSELERVCPELRSRERISI